MTGSTTHGYRYLQNHEPLADVADAMQALAEDVDKPWANYAPAVSGGWALGNGTLSGAWHLTGRVAHVRMRFVAGSTSTYGAGANWSLPINAGVIATNEREPIGSATLFDASTPAYRVWTVILTGANLCALMDPSNGGVLQPTSPWAWAAGDRINFALRYPVA